MSDEQTIFINPEDDVTTVRERLEQISARQLTMVIASQTQLRSHVAWKLLYARARELGKEVVIVSSDPQVRSIAHAVKFNVAHSLESSPLGKSQSEPRSGHLNKKTKASSPLYQRESGKYPSVPRGTRNQRGAATINSRSLRPRTPHPDEKRSWQEYEGQQPRQQADFEDLKDSALLSNLEDIQDFPPALLEDEDLEDFVSSRDQNRFRDDESDLLLEDYTQSQNIRSAARQEMKKTNVIQYRGESGDVLPPANNKPITYLDDQEDATARISEVPPRRSRYLASMPLEQQMLEDDALPPVTRASGKIPVTPPTNVSQTNPKLRASAEPLRQGSPKPSRQLSSQRSPFIEKPRSLGKIAAAGSGSHGRAKAGPSFFWLKLLNFTISRNARFRMIIIILLLLILILLISFVPSAQVKIGVMTQDYSQPLTITARVGQQNTSIPALQFEQDFLKSGTGTATGSQEIGTNPAVGSVTFTDEGASGIVIPFGSIISTDGANPIQFSTKAEVYLSTNDPIPVQVQAVKPGEEGNVDANTITTIPNATLQKIIKQNPSIASRDLKLSVTNKDAITGGGTELRPAVADQDLTTIKNDLSQQLQEKIAAWQHKFISAGSIVGTPITNVTLIKAPKVNTLENNKTFSATVKVSATLLVVHTVDLQQTAFKQLSNDLQKDQSHAKDIILPELNPTLAISQIQQTNEDTHSITLIFNATAKLSPQLISQEYLKNLIKGESISDAKQALKHILSLKTADLDIWPNFLWWVTPWDGHISVIIHPAP